MYGTLPKKRKKIREKKHVWRKPVQKYTETIFNNIIEKYYTNLMKETPIKVLTVYKTQNR